jgi:hypothetical protein
LCRKNINTIKSIILEPEYLQIDIGLMREETYSIQSSVKEYKSEHKVAPRKSEGKFIQIEKELFRAV